MDFETLWSRYRSGTADGEEISQVEAELEKFDVSNDSFKTSKRAFHRAMGRFNAVMEFFLCILSVAVISVGGFLIMQGRMDTVDLITFSLYITTFVNPVRKLSTFAELFANGTAGFARFVELMREEPAMQDAPDAIELDEVKGEIEFRDVWFSYVPGEWVLQGVSFHVDARQTVAFVGSTGSGKSTILSLICRNYEFQKGQILIDGIDIRKIKISSLRRHFGQMLQDVFLFSGTIRSNIVLREEGIPDSEIMEVCRYVNADKFINKLDHGLDEEVRERGNNFSAGQRQLLSFARTIIHKPSVMILDEATANIDTETELLIQDSLEKMRTVGTMLIVAHRLSTIQHADNIIVLSHGKILEQGTHQQLLARHGRYYQLYTLQYHKAQLNAAE